MVRPNSHVFSLPRAVVAIVAGLWVAVVGAMALPCPVEAQIAGREVLLIIDRNETAAAPARKSPPTTSELRWLFKGGIKFYQMFISAQSANTCNFEPSCSHFAQQILDEAPFPIAILGISDRLQRCNGLPGSASAYSIDPATRRLWDPPRKAS